MTAAEGGARRGSPASRVIRWSLLGLVALVILAVVAFLVWANTGIMQAERGPLERVRGDPAVSVVDAGNALVMTPTGPASGTGLVFIPGAKVEANAYLYKLSGAVEKDDLTVVITKPILHLAFFDLRALTDFTDDAGGNVTTWYVGGHSLGGVRACQYAQHPGEQHPKVQGLILFGSYCANDLSQTQLAVLSLSGSNDGLSTPHKVGDTAHLLPEDATSYHISGTNHASFGDYGKQPGDGTATIGSAHMRSIITKKLTALLYER